jgi:hypothetical protein
LVLVGLSSGSQALAQLDVPPEPPLPPPPSPAPLAVPLPPPPAARPLLPAPPGPPAKYQAVVLARSPEWTQDRSFISTRFWRLDPGNFEVQTWFRTRVFDDPKANPTEFLLQQEIEMGVAPHLQIDLYENLTFNVDESGHRGVQQEGNQIEARIAIPRYYGQIFANPVIYLEWHPRHADPDRAEVRLLLGGALTKSVYLAINPYVETNIESTDIHTPGTDTKGMPTVVKSSKFIADMEFGATVAFGFRITEWFRLSAETKIGADMLGDPDNHLHFVWFAGPGLILKPFKNQYFKIMATCLFGIPPSDENAQRYEPLVILGSQF